MPARPSRHSPSGTPDEGADPLSRLMALSTDGYALFDRNNRLCYLSPMLSKALGGAFNPSQLAVQGLAERPALSQFEQALTSLCLPGGAPVAPHSRAIGESQLAGTLLHLKGEPPRTWACRALVMADPGFASEFGAQKGDWALHFRDITRELEVDRLKSAFLSTAAHELRTPLASIYGFSDLLNKRSMPPAQVAEIAEIIHRQSGWLMSLINNLLDLARIDARGQEDARLSDLPLGVILDDTFHGMPNHEPPREWVIECHDRSMLVRAERNRIKKALLQVLLNADQYSPPGRSVRLRSFEMPWEGDEGVCIEVSDQGMGMTPEELSRIFERFYRAHPDSPIKGNGLGMSVVKEVMQLHGGQVWVQSAPGQGTTVRLWLQQALAPQRVADTRE